MQPQSKVSVSIIATLASGFRSTFQQADKSVSDLAKQTTALNAAVGNIQGFKRQQQGALEAGAAWRDAKRRVDELSESIKRQSASGDGGLTTSKEAAKAAAKAYKDARDQVVILKDAVKQSGKASDEQRAALNAAKEAAKVAAQASRAAAKEVDALTRAQKQNEQATARSRAELARAQATAQRLAAEFTEARTKLGDMGRELQRNGVNVANLSKEYRRLKVDVAAAQVKQSDAEASLKRQQKILSGMATTWRGIQNTVVGVAAGAAVLKAPIEKAMNFDERLARLAATAGGGKDTAGKAALKAEMSDMINSARIDSGGSSRDDVLTALNTMISSGKFTEQELPGTLKQVSRTSFASGAAPDEVARMAVSMKQFGITDLQAGFDAALRAGQVGSFELKDMAQWLPEQLAKGKAAGYGGMGGLKEILSLNQASMLTAGRADQAGNNLVNLLQKMASSEFSGSIGKGIKVRAGDPTTTEGKKKEFDWTTYAQRERAKGVNTIDAFGKLLERELAGNKQYQQLKTKSAKLPEGDEKKATLSSMMDIAQGSGLGKIMRDMQASSMMLAYLQGGDTLNNVRKALETSKGATESDAVFMEKQIFAKEKIRSGNIDRANEEAFEAGSPALGKALDGINSLTQSFPKTTAAVYSLSVAASAATVALGGISLLNFVKGRGAAAAATGVAGSLGTGTIAAAGGAALAKPGILARLMGGAGTAVKVGAKGAIIGGALYAADAAMGKLGVNGDVDEDQDEKNWNRASFFEKLQTAPIRGIEKIGRFLMLDNMMNKGASDRIKSETEYLDKKEGKSSPEVEAALKMAAEASNQAANRPNITQSNSYSITITAPAATDAKTLAPELQRELERLDRKREADLRAGYVGNPRY